MTGHRSRLFVACLGLLIGSAAASASADDRLIVGDTPCPAGFTLVTPEEATQGNACSKLATWDIARLAGGGSMDGPGYGCKVRASDTRQLGHTLCKRASAFSAGVGDNKCPSGSQAVSFMVASAHPANACLGLAQWDIARLSDGGSMDGPGYGCGIRSQDTRSLGNTLCSKYEFTKVTGDVPCPSGYRYITPQQARGRSTSLCRLLNAWDIVRLEGGGSMDGPGYGCGIRNFDGRKLGHSFCTNN